MFRPLFAAGYAEIIAENCKGSAVASAAITYLITHPFFRGVARSVQAAGRITPARFVCAKPNVLLSEKRYAYLFGTFIALLGPVLLAQPASARFIRQGAKLVNARRPSISTGTLARSAGCS